MLPGICEYARAYRLYSRRLIGEYYQNHRFKDKTLLLFWRLMFPCSAQILLSWNINISIYCQAMT